MTTPIPELTALLQVRFWAKVDVRGPDECWNWTGSTGGNNYGRVNINKSGYSAHRVSMALDGRDPIDLCALHRCDNPPCCNPAHLFAATQLDNISDRGAKGRQVTLSGTANWNAKLVDSDIRSIRIDARSHRAIAASYGVTHTLVGYIKRNKIWTHVI